MGPGTSVDVIGAIATIGLAGLRWRARAKIEIHAAREAARGQHLAVLPPGSRVVDLGEPGIAIDVFSRIRMSHETVEWLVGCAIDGPELHFGS